MVRDHDDDALEATEDQLTTLRALGVPNGELNELTYADAETWIAELRAEREDAGRPT